MADRHYRIESQYGIGGVCVADLPEDEVLGEQAGKLLTKVVNAPQRTESARQASRVFKEVLRSGRPLDLEVTSGPNRATQPGDPIGTKDVVLPGTEERIPDSETVRLRASEFFVGGAAS